MLANVLRQQLRVALTRPLASVPSRAASLARSTWAPKMMTGVSHFSTSFIRRDATSGSTGLFVGNLPFQIEDEELQSIFSEFGEVSDVRIGRSPDGRSRGFAHISYTTAESAQNAVEAHRSAPIYAQERELRVDISTPRPPRQDRGESEPSAKLYFSSLTNDEQEFRQFLQQHGHEENVRDIFFLTDAETGSRRDAGFLEFNSVESATAAIEALNGASTETGTLQLQYARPKRERSDGPRRDFNGGGGGGYGGGRGGGYGGGRGGREGGYAGGRGGREGGYGGGREGGFGGGRGGGGGYGGGRGGGRGGYGGGRDAGDSGYGMRGSGGGRREGGGGGYGRQGGSDY